MKVLIADDSDLMRKRIKEKVLLAANTEIAAEAVNSLEAKNLISELMPDVAILDIRMPGGSGIDVVKHIRLENKNIFIIILTNYPYDQYKTAALEAGANVFLDKSHEFNKITDIIEELSSQETHG